MTHLEELKQKHIAEWRYDCKRSVLAALVGLALMAGSCLVAVLVGTMTVAYIMSIPSSVGGLMIGLGVFWAAMSRREIRRIEREY